MKKLILFVLCMLAVVWLRAEENLIVSTLLDHVGPVTQFQSGKTKVALVDSVVQIGNIKGKSILDLQIGLNGNTKPQENEVTSANFIAGGFLKINAIIGENVTYPAHWKFLSSLEHGPFLHYDFRLKNWYGGYQAGLAFSLDPK